MVFRRRRLTSFSRRTRRPVRYARRTLRRRRIPFRRGARRQARSATSRQYGVRSIAPRALSRLLQSEAGVHTAPQAGNNSGLLPYMRCLQVYADRVTLGDGTLAPAWYTFRLNSTFDPDESGGGHQPRGRDTMAIIYNDYVVIGCYYRVVFRSNADSQMKAGCLITTDSSPGTNFDSLSEVVESRGRYCKQVEVRANSENVNGEIRVITGYVPMRRFMLSTAGSYQEQFGAGVGANPATVVRMHLFAMTPTGGAIATNALAAEVTLKYDVVYKSPVGNFAS